MLKLDYTLESIEERKDLVNRIIAENQEMLSKDTEYSRKYMDILGDYLIFCMDKQERKQRQILTDNRMATVNKRETSFEGLVAQFENGEDGIYNLMTEDKNMIFQPKLTITKRDVDEIPELKQCRDVIHYWESRFKTATGKERFIIKNTLIDFKKDQYLIKDAFRGTIHMKQFNVSRAPILFEDYTYINSQGDAVPGGASFLDPDVCSAILCNYSGLVENAWENFEGDAKYLMWDFDILADKALKDYPIYEAIVTYKIDGLKNVEIQQKLQEEFGVCHSVEYISSLWRQKIPTLIALAAEDQYLNWYYTNEAKGKFKKCSKCGEIKLAHNKYFSKNKTSKDGFYSICKKCRNKKDKTE